MHKTRKNSKKYSKKKIYGGKITCKAPHTKDVQLEHIINYINTDVDEIIIHGGKIPEKCFTHFNEKKYFKKENFNSHVLSLLNEYGTPIINQREERETSTSYSYDAAREWHREFHYEDNNFSQTWHNSWVCIAYLKLDNCKNNCGTEILYYNKHDKCKKINLQASANDFILFRDCKLIHKIPNSTFVDKDKPIVRKLYRIYIKTGEHEDCDTRLIRHTKNIDFKKGSEPVVEELEEVEYISTGRVPSTGLVESTE
jgi:hypothetical protein